MQSSIFILGRQSDLGLAELESLFGANLVHPIGNIAALVDIEPKDVDFNRIGGSIKLAGLLTTIETTAWHKLIDYISGTLPQNLGYLPEGKLKFGISTFGLNVSPSQVNKSNLALKKIIKASGRSVRVVPNKEAHLNSAQVLHNQLTSPLGMELILIRNGGNTILAQTVQEQDIDSYAYRDHGRPKRDSKVGMLPPKLAQIIVNIALKDSKQAIVLDPFCGTGVILQEALLMKQEVVGTDIEPRMIEYTKSNLEWLKKSFKINDQYSLSVVDAMKEKWESPFDVVACETYLGRPLNSPPDEQTLEKIIKDCDFIHKKFLINLASQTKTGTSIVLAVPAWKINDRFIHLGVVDHLEEMGYTEARFVHVRGKDLIYHREGQIVARELLVLTRK